MKTDLVAILMICCALVGWGAYVVYDYYSVDSVDIDCLFDLAESYDINDLTIYTNKPILTEDWTIAQIKDFYYQKYPKSRLAAELMATQILNRCEK